AATRSPFAKWELPAALCASADASFSAALISHTSFGLGPNPSSSTSNLSVAPPGMVGGEPACGDTEANSKMRAIFRQSKEGVHHSDAIDRRSELYDRALIHAAQLIGVCGVMRCRTCSAIRGIWWRGNDGLLSFLHRRK